MPQPTRQPAGRVITRTLAMPADTNANGDIFGGWIMAQMDIAAGMVAKQVCLGRAVTVAVDAMRFLRPVRVGDAVTCYGSVERVGRTSIGIRIEVWAVAATESVENQYCVTEATFTFVAIDDAGQPVPVKRDGDV